MMAPKIMAPPPAMAKPTDAVRNISTDPQTTAPMIARTVALTLIVKDVERSRQSLEELLRTYNGYAAQMDVSTPEAGRRTLHASLRIPAGQTRVLLAELKGYGKVASETQSGEEVGQQHADLLARLNTARESEERLRAILKNRTGDVSDVLQVEQAIARVRTEIESMEAEQQGLEHRVSYATVDLQMSEEGQGPTSPAVSSRLAAAARQGWDNATETVLGFITFLLQYGLALAFILALVGIPAWLAVKWWRRLHPNP